MSLVPFEPTTSSGLIPLEIDKTIATKWTIFLRTLGLVFLTTQQQV